ncbi:MAG: pilus assembly protein [Nocardioides sp.]|nr:pilus assembly protein [Nocardioides sp.]
MRPRIHARTHDQSGAAAVEFALVSSVLMLIVFGILQYGLYFNDSLNVRQGVREAARMAVVKSFSCGDETAQWAAFECTVDEQVGALTGPTHVRLSAPEGWKKGNPLIVCAVVASGGGGMLPMPNDGHITSRLRMSIEVDDAPPTGAPAASVDPSGGGWAWCA